jgi:hypothetical protein
VPLVNTIPQIQSEELTSPFVGKTVFRVSGVVTAVGSDRYYLQDIEGDHNAHTSDGIVVFTGPGNPPEGTPSGGSPQPLEVGDIVTIETATVEERFDDLTSTTTSLLLQPTTVLVGTDPADTVIESGGNSLPEPVKIGAIGRLPPTEGMTAHVEFWESLEGMLVEIQNPVAISPFGSFSGYVTPDHGHYATGLSSRGTLSVSPTDWNPERIQIIESTDIFAANVPDDAAVGTKFENILGVVSIARDVYTITPTANFGIIQDSQLEPATTSCKKGSHKMSVATYDLSPYSNRTRAAEHIANNLRFPDVLALQSISDGNVAALINEIASVSGKPNPYEQIPSGGSSQMAILYNKWLIREIMPNAIPMEIQGNFSALTQPISARLEFIPLEQEFDIINVRFQSNLGGPFPSSGVNQPFEQLLDVEEINSDVNKRLEQSNAVRDLIEEVVEDQSKLIVLG